MRGGIQNTIITCCIVILVIICTASAIWLGYSSSGRIIPADTNPLTHQTWWFGYDKTPMGIQNLGIPFHYAGIAALLVLILIGTIVFKFQFKKLGSTELFFFVLFLASMSFEAFRFASIAFYLFQLPVFFHTIITRIIYFGRIASLLFLLFSSLYACEIRYQKSVQLAGLVLIVSLTLSYLISLDSTQFLSTFLYKLNDELGIFLINGSLALFSVINFIIAAFKRHKRFGYISIACVLFLAGRELIYFSASPIPSIAALACCTLGIVIFYREIDRIYLLT